MRELPATSSSRARGGFGGRPSEGFNQDKGRQNFRARYTHTSFPVVSVSPSSALSPFGIPSATRTCFIVDCWRIITDDQWVLSTVTEGIRFEFFSGPGYREQSRDIRMTEEAKLVCQEEVKKLLEKGAISIVRDGSSVFFPSSPQTVGLETNYQLEGRKRPPLSAPFQD